MEPPRCGAAPCQGTRSAGPGPAHRATQQAHGLSAGGEGGIGAGLALSCCPQGKPRALLPRPGRAAGRVAGRAGSGHGLAAGVEFPSANQQKILPF